MRRVGKCRIQYTRVEPSTVGERNVVYSGVREGGEAEIVLFLVFVLSWHAI